MDNSTMKCAQRYAKSGFSVIPLVFRHVDKKPLIAWSEYQRRHPTDDELQKWFNNGNLNNIAIVTGLISGVAVLDFDTEESIQVAKKLGLPPTPMVKTARGFHAYYRYKDGIRNFQKRDDLPGIDLRGDGGYVVAPPSVHASGHQYRWVEGRGLDDLPLADFPEIFLVRDTKDKKPIAELYKGATEGNRNDTLARLAGSWVRDGLTFEECIENAFLWNTKNTTPLLEREIERTVKSIFEKHQKSVSQFHDPIYSHKTKKLEITTLTDVYKSSAPQWLVEGLILECGVTLLTAYAKDGKTFLTMEIARCVAMGEPLFGFLTTTKGGVLFVDNENGWQLLKDRYQKLGVNEDQPIKYLSFQPVRLDTPDGVDALKEKVKEINPTLIIFDSLTRFHKKKENESGDMAMVMEAFRSLANDGYTVLVVHHHRKGEGREEEKPRGSGDILASVDNLLVLKKEENAFVLSFQTGRINGLDRPIRYTIENSADSAVSFKYLGKVLSKKEELFELVKEILRNREMGFEGLHQEIKERGLTVGEGKLRDALNEWKGKELLERPSEHNKKFYRVNPSFSVSRDIYTLRNWETENQQETIPVEDIKIVG